MVSCQRSLLKALVVQRPRVGCVVVFHVFVGCVCPVPCLSVTRQLTAVDLLLCGALNFYFKVCTSYRKQSTAHCSEIVRSYHFGAHLAENPQQTRCRQHSIALHHSNHSNWHGSAAASEASGTALARYLGQQGAPFCSAELRRACHLSKAAAAASGCKHKARQCSSRNKPRSRSRTAAHGSRA
jgi:hypothetical protein